MAKSLELSFQGLDKTVTMSVRNLKDPLTPTEIKTAMEAMIQSNAFSGGLVSVKGARTVDRVTQDITFA